ncbi:MAG: immunoglobulin domain-containing protein [Nibricoccus sp.]
MRKLLACCVAAVVVGFALYLCPTKRQAPKPVAVKNDAVRVVALPIASGDVAQPAAPSEKLVVETTDAKVVTIPLAQAFPGLEKPSDWRKAFGQTTVVFHVDGVDYRFDGAIVDHSTRRSVWIGKGIAPNDSMVVSATKDFADAVILATGAPEYQVHLGGGEVRIVTIKNSHPCGSISEYALARYETDLATAHLEDKQPHVEPDLNAEPLPVATEYLPAPDTTVYYHDICLFYLPDLKVTMGSTPGEVENTYAAWLATCNYALANSGVNNFRWRLVGSCPAPADYNAARKVYDGTTVHLTDDLHAISYASGSDSTDSNPSLYTLAEAKRTEFAADSVCFIVDAGPAKTVDYGGIAWLGWNNSVVYRSNGVLTVAHELAHNSNCNHDRANASSAADGDNKYNYGYTWKPSNTFDVYISSGYGDIMSYLGSRCTLFANPNIYYGVWRSGTAAYAIATVNHGPASDYYTYKYKVTGQSAFRNGDTYIQVGYIPVIQNSDGTAVLGPTTVGNSTYNRLTYDETTGYWSTSYYVSAAVTYAGDPTGLPIGNTRAAYCAKTLEEWAPTVSAWKTEKPQITTQPVATTVANGSDLTLTVGTSGTVTSYKWYKNGVEIANSNSAIYTKVACRKADAGSFYVVVSNTSSSVTSDTVAVTVTGEDPGVVTPTPDPSPAPVTSNQGGGGACGLEYLVALAAVGVVRLLRRR